MRRSLPPERCPYLGLPDDPQTWLAFPAPANCCHKPAVPQPVTPAYQQRACLAPAFAACPVYRYGAIWDGLLPEGILGNSPDQKVPPQVWWPFVVAATGLLLIGLAAGWYLLQRNAPASAVSGTSLPTTMPATLTPSPVPDTSQPVVNPVPSPLPTALPASPTVQQATPVLVTATSPPTEAVLAFESNLRSGPGLDFDVITVLGAETTVAVLGRDETASWLLVRAPGDLVGWIAVIQFQEGLEVETLPVRTGADAGTMTATEPTPATVLPVLVTAVEPTATAQVPSTFRISLYSAQKGLACYSDFEAEYRFTITGGLLSVFREIDSAVLLGTYDARSSTFEASATYSFGIERLTGTILFDGQIIAVEGEQHVAYFERACDGWWAISGETVP